MTPQDNKHTPEYPETGCDAQPARTGNPSFDQLAGRVPAAQCEPSPMDALDVQIGGGHYKDFAIQPVEFITRNCLSFLEGSVVKRVCRHGSKAGAEDIRKAIHELELILQLEYKECVMISPKGTSQTPVILYHAKCYDGFLSAYAAWMVFGDAADYIACNYGEPLPELPSERPLYFVDFSADYETINKLSDKHPKVTVIDHHKTAEAELVGKAWAQNVHLIFDMEKAGCVLSAEHFLGYVPWYFMFVGDRDIWKFEFGLTKEFTTGFFAEFPLHELTFAKLEDTLVPTPWSSYVEAPSGREIQDCDRLARTGQTLIEYRNTLMRGWLADMRELDVRLINVWDAPRTVGMFNNIPIEFISELAHMALEANPQIQCVVVTSVVAKEFENTICKVSLRSMEGHADVSEIAKLFGGGGHRNAAGFEVGVLEAVDMRLI